MERVYQKPDAFFVDEIKSALKMINSELWKALEKKLLDKLEGSSDYNAAKTKYEDLVKQKFRYLKVNSQFISQSSKMEFLMQLKSIAKQRQAMKN